MATLTHIETDTGVKTLTYGNLVVISDVTREVV